MVFNRMQGSHPGSYNAVRPAKSDNIAMNLVLDNLVEERAAIFDGGDLILATDCLYFDATSVAVRISISPRGERIAVSDEGNAVDRVVASGRKAHAFDRTAKAVAKRHGLASSNGVLIAYPDSADEVSAYVALVANASVELAMRLREVSLPRDHRDITAEMIERLDSWFPGIATRKKAEISGSSNKVHTFDLEATMGDGKIILLDEIRPKRVNTILAAGFDVGRRQDVNLSIWAIYDPAMIEAIGSPNLSLLSSVTRTVAIDRVSKDLLAKAA